MADLLRPYLFSIPHNNNVFFLWSTTGLRGITLNDFTVMFFLERLVHSNLIPQFVPSLPKLLTWVVWEWSERKTLALESSINEAVRWKYQESQISLTHSVKKNFFSGTYFNRFCVCGEKHWGLKSMELCHMIGRTPDGFIIVILYKAGLGLIRCQHWEESVF